MSDTVQIVTAILTFLGTIFTALMAYLLRRLDTKVTANGKAVEAVHIATNSMKDALVEATGEGEHAKGVLAGIAQQKKVDKSSKPKGEK